KDDDAQPVSLSAAPNPVAEGNSVTVTASLSAPLSSSVTIPLVLTAGTAEAGDYGALASITIAAGQTTATGTISTTEDADYDDETFTVALGTLPASVVAGSPSAVEVRIEDDDEPTPVSLSAAPNPVAEGNSVTVTASLSAPLSSSVTIPLVLTAGTAEAGDYGALASITIAAGQTTATGTISTTEDADYDDETFTVALGTLPASVTAGSPSSVEVRIEDDDEPPPPVVEDDDEPPPVIEDDEEPPPPVSLSVEPTSVAEGNSVTVTASLSAPLSSSVTIPLVLTAGTAEAGDYGTLASITIAAEQTTATGTISTTEDADHDDETFTAALGTLPAPLAAGSPSAVEVRIEDNDTPGIALSTSSLHIRGCGLVAYTIRLLSQPKANVIVTVESDARGVATASPARVVFTAENWNRDRRVTVTPGAGGRASITHWVSSSDPSYDTVRLTRTLRVTVDEAVPASVVAPWQVRFVRSHTAHVLDGIAGRIVAEPKAGAWASQPTGSSRPGGDEDSPASLPVAGTLHRTYGTGTFGADGWRGAAVPGSRSIAVREALAGSSFALTGEKAPDGSVWSVWGRGSWSRFRGRENMLALDGEAWTATVDVDRRRGRSQMGLALSHSLGEGEYGGGTCSGGIESSLTSVVPHAALQVSDRLTLWGALGYGWGAVTFKPDTGFALKADTTFTMAATGMRGGLLAPAENGPALALVSDAMWMRTRSERVPGLAASDSSVTRLRFGLEGSWRVALEGGGHVIPKLEVGARHDGGDAETGAGVELGGGLAWSDPALNLSLDVKGRTLLAHEDGAFENRGVAAGLVFDPSPATERGPSLTLRSSWGGRAEGGLDALFAPAPLKDRIDDEAEARWTTEAAYGLPAFGGRFTGSPHAGFGFSDSAHDYTLGWRLAPADGVNAPDLSFGLKATRRENDRAATEHTVEFKVRTRW
ncbi:MAG: autotransporter outer membrane beta-barrel domain-containing protein, partial [Nitrospira sp. SB0661_bin_20]|nr:autotransporter outer membrane beta-barrel domain-containing protein [Nitrospira sp. SB0661_bin_20]